MILLFRYMDKTELVALIASRSHKLKAYREQAANGNEYFLAKTEKKRGSIWLP